MSRSSTPATSIPPSSPVAGLRPRRASAPPRADLAQRRPWRVHTNAPSSSLLRARVAGSSTVGRQWAPRGTSSATTGNLADEKASEEVADSIPSPAVAKFTLFPSSMMA
ncbi:hypothetical protein PVAP13_8NG071400 [Panicum virgatum]|uniref:Uncharacterized protein n=1 Tax=Panicum virgatum TaxID=38727 RepID=A0A8T0P2C8_PANVG|nr:hypothetical protein PVAP13_8NG071400 [Panicum virgatum]